MDHRTEYDFLGEKQVPRDAYYGIQTIRAVENFPITGVPIHKELIIALAHVKKAAAIANMDIHMLPSRIGMLIVTAAEEIANGQFLDQFIVDSIQGGAGTSINMNMNEVIANRVLELMEKKKGEYFHCSPNTHVNMAQSTNDVIPTSIRIAAYGLTLELLEKMIVLKEGFKEKEKEFDDVIKMGRTHLQDAVPIRLGQEFGAYAAVLERDIGRVRLSAQHLLTINMGATAVGTGLNANPDYIEKVSSNLKDQLLIPLQQAENLVDATQNTDMYTELSSSLKVCAVNLSKISNDIRLMASGPKVGFNELFLPPRQPGSSIMPGKVNPVMAEVLNQVAFQVMGNDHTIGMGCEAGQMELNVMVPVVSFNLLQSLKILKNGIDVFYTHLICGLEANKEHCFENVENSFGIITALNPHLGYEVAAELVKDSKKTDRTVKEICLERGLLTEDEINEILDPYQMTTPGIAGSKFLKMH